MLDKHVAWDIGAAGVTRRLQARFDADAVLAGYSRLVIDLNRSLDDGSSIPTSSDGVLIPGNLSLTPAERAARARSLHAPYHAAINELVERRSGPERVPVFIGVHSFTPWFHGTLRPWQIGVLWDRDARLALPLLDALRSHRDICVGDNEPYSGRHTADYSIDRHAEARGIAHAGIELRQDLIDDDAGCDRWSELLGDALALALNDASIFKVLAQAQGSEP